MEILRVNELSKLYRLGEFNVRTLTEDVQLLWSRIRGKPNPLLPVEDHNVRKNTPERYFWALKDITFSLNKGDTLGVIGRNGAGKSTLLKILSKVTKPTEGEVYFNGSISSLLEVGTGFDRRLTGRENVFLSGSILGMSRVQIENYYKDIVEFSGVGRFMDTPVARYSSGMYLRLAFSVAAHLQSQILILDEVLAVGDYDFKRKAVQHVKQMATSNRTIIYVAHQLDTVRALCSKGILLEKGRIKTAGEIGDVLDAYGESDLEHAARFHFEAPLNADCKGYVRCVSVLDGEGKFCSEVSLNDSWKIKVDFFVHQKLRAFRVTLRTNSAAGTLINVTQSDEQIMQPGHYTAFFEAKELCLGVSTYLLSVTLSSNMETFEKLEDSVPLHIIPSDEKSGTMFVEPYALIASPFKVDVSPSKEE